MGGALGPPLGPWGPQKVKGKGGDSLKNNFAGHYFKQYTLKGGVGAGEGGFF